MYVQGDGAPTDAHPDTIGKEGARNINFSQRLPYFSHTLKKDPQTAEVIEHALQEIADYVHAIIARFLPNEYKTVKAFVDVLPLNYCPITYPFASFVVNVQGATEAHKDPGDDTLCVTIPFGEWTDGDLILYESGVVLDLVVGDIIAFPSCSLTHFNMDFDGIRGSVIFFSDKHGKDWVRFRNGWNEHMVVPDDFGAEEDDSSEKDDMESEEEDS